MKGFDVDIDALTRCKANIEKIEIDNIDLVQVIFYDKFKLLRSILNSYS